jgi:glycosyltransferase involved in cell wall biosynthesis
MPMLYLFDGYIFTTPNELDYAQRFRPFNRLNSRIIPAVSNIPFLSDKSSSAPLRNPALVAYFGQIVPNKGLEDFLELVSLSRSSSAPLDFLIVGATPDWARNYWEAIVSRATKLQCELKLNLAAADVSRELARATFGYFPYPDGACLKRGTLPAAIEHGLILITKWGEKTEPDVKAVTIRADNARSAFNEILQISSTPTKLDQIIRARTQFNSKYSTSAIIDGYLSFYKSLIGSSLFRLENPQDKPSPVS